MKECENFRSEYSNDNKGIPVKAGAWFKSIHIATTREIAHFQIGTFSHCKSSLTYWESNFWSADLSV
jgi:hypothetical protein